MRRTLRRAAKIGAWSTSFALWSPVAGAVDVGQIGRDTAQLDVTETSIAAQHFDGRGNELPQDSGWGGWVNRLNAALRWRQWTAGLRVDSAVYWRRPIDIPNVGNLPQVIHDNESRYRNSIYPAKLWVTYAAPGIEVTLGDAYAQFGRGLTLSLRKIDELGIDTTVRGLKVEVQKDPFALTAIAGLGNPSRLDEATGRALFPTTGNPSAPIFGSDRIVGVELQAGRGLPLTFATHFARFSRCAPYHYAEDGHIVTDPLADPGGVTFGSCDPNDISQWFRPIPIVPPTLAARVVTMAGQSIEVPSLGGHGKLYVEAAVQQRQYGGDSGNTNDVGNALYASLSSDFGPVTGTLEVKSNRNFYPAAATIDVTRAPEFNVVSYSFAPPAETPTILDTEFGNFNACVDGGRLRADVSADENVLLYGQGIFARTKSEQTSGGCDAQGHAVSPQGHTLYPLTEAEIEDTVWDGLSGVEWYFDDKLSHVFLSTGARDDTKASGGFYYRELHFEYSIVKYLGKAYSIEVQGFHRRRRESQQNLVQEGGNVDTPALVEQWWNEGENYVAFKVAPAWVFSQGFEYTTLLGPPKYYLNGSVLYKFTSGSNVRLLVGQQRGAFRCASGVCRAFPPFEGARAELTIRF